MLFSTTQNGIPECTTKYSIVNDPNGNTIYRLTSILYIRRNIILNFIKIYNNYFNVYF